MNIQSYLFATICTLIAIHSANGDLILTFSDGGGSVVNFTFAGSDEFTASTGITSNTAGGILMPTSTRWASAFTANNDWSDANNQFYTGDGGDSTATTSTPVSILVNGIEVPHSSNSDISNPVYNFFDLSSASDSLDIDSNTFGAWTYPAISAGDVVSWEGSGSFTLSSGTFASNFNVGTFLLDTGTGITYGINVVPEPCSGVAIMCCFAAASLKRKR